MLGLWCDHGQAYYQTQDLDQVARGAAAATCEDRHARWLDLVSRSQGLPAWMVVMALQGDLRRVAAAYGAGAHGALPGAYGMARD